MLRLFSNFIQLLILLALAPLAIALFLAYLLLRLLLRTLFGAVRYVLFLAGYLVTHALELMLEFSFVFILGAIGLWLFWRINPEFRAAMGEYRTSISRWTQEHLGFPVPRLPGPGDLADTWEKKPERTTLYDALGPEAIPRELEPVSRIPQKWLDVERYKYLIWTMQSGARAEATVPLLREALAGPDLKLAKAARECLRRIGTEEAIKALEEADATGKK